MSNTAQSYKENYLSAQRQTKNVESNRKHQTKKQAFGEIKNVIHNHGMGTVIKPDPNHKNASARLISPADVKIKQQNRNEYKSSSNLKTQRVVLANSDNTFDLDDFDFRGKCCSLTSTSDQQIWSEMNLFSDAFLDDIFDDNKLNQIEHVLCVHDKTEENRNESKILDEENDKSDFIYWSDKKSHQDDTDLHLMFEKPPVLDFNF